MHAIQQHSFGGPDVLTYTELPDPTPCPGHVRVRVEVAGVHRIDTLIRAGTADPSAPPALPMVPGREIAGVVDAVGDDVDERWRGQLVVAHLGAASGGYAEMALAPVDALHGLAPSADPAAAVAMIGTGRTAMAVLDAAPLRPTDRVLVLAASGGLGSLLLQAADRSAEAAVGVTRGDKAELVGSIGVRVVDHEDEAWPTHVERILAGPPTVVIDPVGGSLGLRAFELLPPGGRHALVAAASGTATPLDADTLMARGVSAVGALGPHLARDASHTRMLQRRALEQLAQGQWAPLLTPFDLTDASGAHRAIEARATIGKVILWK